MFNWPEGKRFAFTVIDDTDNATLMNIKPVYDMLQELNMKTTKTVWVYPPRDHFTGQSLQDDEYLKFIQDIHNKGFEIALHNVGSGKFNQDEIISGLDLFKKRIGSYPIIQINHSSNLDNIYWGYQRYVFPLRNLIKLLYKDKRKYYGSDPASQVFWGDVCKKHIKFIRNLCFNGINTLKYDPQMPFINPEKEKYSNYWFSSSDGHTVEEFTKLISKKNIDRLERENGACIVYTHFASGFVDSTGKIDEIFKKRMEYLSGKNAWFVPAGELLGYLLKQRQTETISYSYLFGLDMHWLKDRIIKKLRFGR